MANNDRRLTTGDIMRYCHVSRSTALKWIKSNKLDAYYHPDGQYRITRDALLDFLERYNMPVDEVLLEERGEPQKVSAKGEVKKGRGRRASGRRVRKPQ